MPSQLGVQRKDLIVRLLYSAATVTAAASAILLTAATACTDRTARLSKPNHLQIDGPFRYVRNPQYLGYFLLLAALGTFQSRLGLPVMLVVETVFLVRLMGHEEMLLERKYRRGFFVHYRQAVPRIIPSLRPRIKASSEVPLWRLAFWKNAFQWASVVTLLAFAATLTDSVGYAFTAIAIAIGVVSRLTNLFPRPRSTNRNRGKSNDFGLGSNWKWDTGLEVVKQAISRQWKVRALVRSPRWSGIL